MNASFIEARSFARKEGVIRLLNRLHPSGSCEPRAHEAWNQAVDPGDVVRDMGVNLGVYRVVLPRMARPNMIERRLSNDKVWDVCVVGTGPVGMALALEFDRLGDEVLVLESGGSEVGQTTAEASRAQIVDPNRHAAMEIAVCRALGGTSWTWGGRCVAYDDVDWMKRDFVADAGWPVGHDEIRPWYAQAARHLLCGNNTFSIPFKRGLTGGLTLDFVERWARQSKVILAHRNHLLRSERIKIILNSAVTALNLSTDGQRVESLTVSMQEGPRTVKAHCIVLAMGGASQQGFF